jgi:D-serine deaminase-like pyridoxal phosphate-dependent protein
LAAVLEYSRLNSNTHKKKWSVFLKVDCGYHRHGTDPFDPESLTLAEQLAKVHQDFVEFAGIYSHSGHSYTGKTDEEIMNVAKSECQVMTKFVNFLESEKGITPPVVSVGATPSCTHLPEKEDLGRVTEIHPGNYVFFDRSQYELGSCKEEEVSAWVMCRVVAHYPARHTFAIDAGALAFSKDEGPIHLHTNDICGYGLIKGHPELRIVKVTQEIGLVKYPQHDSGKNYSQEFGLGKLIFVLPNHSCLTAALYDKYFVVEKFDDNLERFADNEKVIDVWRPCRGW